MFDKFTQKKTFAIHSTTSSAKYLEKMRPKIKSVTSVIDGFTESKAIAIAFAIGYEPTGLNVHTPPPQKKKKRSKVDSYFSHGCLVPLKKNPKKVDIVRDIRIRSLEHTKTCFFTSEPL